MPAAKPQARIGARDVVEILLRMWSRSSRTPRPTGASVVDVEAVRATASFQVFPGSDCCHATPAGDLSQ